MEQFLNSLPADIQCFVVSKQPVDSEQCSEYADLHAELAKTAVKSDPLWSNRVQNETTSKSQAKVNVGNKTGGIFNGAKNGQKTTNILLGLQHTRP